MAKSYKNIKGSKLIILARPDFVRRNYY